MSETTAGPTIDGRGQRLQKYLARAGVASRRECEELIAAGRVAIDGDIVTTLGTRVMPGEQEVRVDGRVVEPLPSRWIAVHKPAGYLSARGDDRGRPTVYSIFPDELSHLFHVGRLDRATEGLLVFTNEGQTAHRLLHPRYGIRRRYRVEVEGGFDDALAAALERGLELDDGVAVAEDVEFQPAAGGSVAGESGRWIVHLTLREGRKREVRRLMEALGLGVRRLVRVSFGPIELEGLAPGAWRDLTTDEVRALRAAVGTGEDRGNH